MTDLAEGLLPVAVVVAALATLVVAQCVALRSPDGRGMPMLTGFAVGLFAVAVVVLAVRFAVFLA